MTTPPANDDGALLRTLARATGWYCEKSAFFDRKGYSVYGLDRMPIGFSETVEGAWQIAFDQVIPAWLHSVDAALGLPWPKSHFLEILIMGERATVVLYPHAETEVKTKWQADGTLARALCEVFAQWWNDTHKEEADGE